jgi:hypothetical protein
MNQKETPQIEVLLNEVVDELQPGGCASGEIEWDTVIEAMKRYATIKCKEQREICSKVESITYRVETLEDGEEHRNDVLNAPSPEI